MSYNKLRFAPLKNDNPLSFFLTLRNVRCQLIIILLAGVVIAGCNGKPDSNMKQSEEQILSEKMDKDTFGNSEEIKLSDNFINVKINTDKNPEDARKYKVRGLPTIIFLKSNGEIIETVSG